MKLNLSRFFDLHRYAQRKKSDYFLIEGEKNILEAEKNGLKPMVFSTYEKDSYEKISLLEMRKITGNNFVKEVGICKKFQPTFDLNNPFFLFDGLVDYGNIGTIMRTLFSFGFLNMIFIMKQGDLFHHRVFEASRGLFFFVKPACCSTEEAINIIKTYNLKVICIDLGGESIEKNIFSNKNKTIFTFGSEANGVSKEIKEISQKTLTIPINFESINVAVATGIFAYILKDKQL